MSVDAQATWNDEEPPLLEDDDEPEVLHGNQAHAQDEASVMDEMVAVATKANAVKKKQQEQQRQLNSKSFGAGLKKGFFSSASKKPKAKPSSKEPQRLDVDEATNKKKKEESLRIVNQTTNNQANENEKESSPFVFPEVQDALKSVNQLNPKDWMDAKFFAKLAKHPKLLQALQNPRFSQAINELQRDPQAAIMKYQSDVDVSLMLRDFMGFLGDHFEELGKEQETTQQPKPPSPAPTPAIVDLDDARRQAIANMKRSPDEEQQVQQIMENPELLAVLSDAKFMVQLRRCQEDPRLFQQLTRDPVLAPKLRLLVDAKMVRFA